MAISINQTGDRIGSVPTGLIDILMSDCTPETTLTYPVALNVYSRGCIRAIQLPTLNHASQCEKLIVC